MNDDEDDGVVDVHVVDNDDDGDAKEVIQSSTSLPRGNQVDGLPRVCSICGCLGRKICVFFAKI